MMVPFYDTYGNLLAYTMSGKIETNLRTGVRVAVARGGSSFKVDLSDGLLPTIGYRKTFPKSAAAEIAWYLQGTQDAEFIRKYAPLWDKFVEPLPVLYSLDRLDDVVSETFEGVEAAYGYRWRKHFGRDQIALAVQTLKKDPSNRRVYISAWDPATDGLGEVGQRNVPCPAAFTFSITDGELHSTLFLRSSDLFVGLPYDVMGHALLMDAMAAELRVSLGVMHVAISHLHLYEVHWAMARESMSQTPVVPRMQLPGWNLRQIEEHPDDYVLRYAEEAKQHTWPTYNPKPEVIE